MRIRGFHRRAAAAGVCAAALAAGLAACAGDGGEPGQASPAEVGSAAASRYATPLGGVCPDPVVVQTGWWPQAEDAFLYQLLGPDPTVDKNANRVTGKLGGTGVGLEIRAGGPAVGFQPVSSVLAQDDAILLGNVATDEAVQTSGSHPMVAVFAAYEKSPLAFLWGEGTWDFRSVADIGAAGVPVLGSAGAAYLDVFQRQGLLRPAQVDTSYQGGPDRFVAADGKLVQQGLVTSEPYRLEHDVAAWGKPVRSLLLHDAYPVYLLALATRADALEAHRACLAQLVPLFQQAQRDYAADPGPAHRLLLDAVGGMDTGGFTLTPGLLADAHAKQRDLGLLADGPDGVLGSFDAGRVQKLIEALAPVFESQGAGPKPGLAPADLVTNAFLDPQVWLH